MGYWDKDLKQVGLNPETLTDEQKEIILQPLDAPENYYQDGEIEEAEALEWWKWRLEKTGLSKIQITKAIKFNR